MACEQVLGKKASQFLNVNDSKVKNTLLNKQQIEDYLYFLYYEFNKQK